EDALLRIDGNDLHVAAVFRDIDRSLLRDSHVVDARQDGGREHVVVVDQQHACVVDVIRPDTVVALGGEVHHAVRMPRAFTAAEGGAVVDLVTRGPAAAGDILDAVPAHVSFHRTVHLRHFQYAVREIGNAVIHRGGREVIESPVAPVFGHVDL